MSASSPPAELNRVPVVAYARLGHIKQTRSTIHRTPLGVLPPPRALAICQDRDESRCHLCYCDRHWKVLADTTLASEAEAKQLAESEFHGVGVLWRNAA